MTYKKLHTSRAAASASGHGTWKTASRLVHVRNLDCIAPFPLSSNHHLFRLLSLFAPSKLSTTRVNDQASGVGPPRRAMQSQSSSFVQGSRQVRNHARACIVGLQISLCPRIQPVSAPRYPRFGPVDNPNRYTPILFARVTLFSRLRRWRGTPTAELSCWPVAMLGKCRNNSPEPR